jgi:hypothetical protein
MLLTTFDARKRDTAHQSISAVVQQASAEGLGLVGVPLHAGRPYLEGVERGLQVVARNGYTVRRLCFADSGSNRAWREEKLAPLAAGLGASLHFQ